MGLFPAPVGVAQNPKRAIIFPGLRPPRDRAAPCKIPGRYRVLRFAAALRRLRHCGSGAALPGDYGNPSQRGVSPEREKPTMKNFSEFQILGRVGKTKTFQGKVNVTICANYSGKDKDGQARDNPHWNEVSVFSEAARAYITEYCKPGDLVLARGRVKQSRFERDGETIYSVDFVCDEFSILASKAQAVDQSAASSTEDRSGPRKRRR